MAEVPEATLVAAHAVEAADDVHVVRDAATDQPTRSASNGRLSRYFAAISGASVVALVVIVAAVVRPVTSPGLAGAVHALPASLSDVCAEPTSMFARFWNDAAASSGYSTAVRVGTTNLPAPTMYISDGPAGGGVLCAVAPGPAGPDQPLLGAALARTGAVAYIADYQFAPFGAVRPGVTRVTIEVARTSEVLVLHDRWFRRHGTAGHRPRLARLQFPGQLRCEHAHRARVQRAQPTARDGHHHRDRKAIGGRHSVTASPASRAALVVVLLERARRGGCRAVPVAA